VKGSCRYTAMILAAPPSTLHEPRALVTMLMVFTLVSRGAGRGPGPTGVLPGRVAHLVALRLQLVRQTP
jgi:hypothetical protein